MIFRLAHHMVRGVEVVEVFDNAENLMATIYPADDTGIRIMSRHVASVVSLKDVDGVEGITIAFKRR